MAHHGPYSGRFGKDDPMSYTLPNGRQATPKQERERMTLLEARRTCPECIRLSREAVRKSDYSFGACQCPEHRS